jgi:chromosome partitioning protein
MIIAAFNPKGGVGKTTTAVNVAAVLAARGRSVLLIDLEADCNATISLGIPRTDVHPSIAEVLLRQAHPAAAVRVVPDAPGLHVITGSPELMRMEAGLRHVRQPERRLGDIVMPLATEFDVVILDTPAGYSTLSLAVTLAADELIVPIRADYLALESLAQLLAWYRDRRAAGHARARLAGLLLTMVDYRRQATREIVDIIRLHNRRGVFDVEIPDDPRVAEAPSHGLPVVRYAPRARASRAYDQLTDELLKRIRRPV